MKNKRSILMSAVLTTFFFTQSWVVKAAELNLREQFDQGLMQEEVHQNLEKAVEHYQGVVNAFDEQRSVIAMSVFRLAECLRKLGRMDEAAPLYARVVTEFSDQESISLLSQRFVPTSAPIPEVVTPDTKIIDHPTSLKLLIQQLHDVESETALRTLMLATGDTLALNLSSIYREAKAELAQLQTRYLDKWPGIVEKKAKIASLENQMKSHVQQAIKNLELRLVALEAVQKSSNKTSPNNSKSLVNDPRTLRLFIEELEKATTEVALQILMQETGLEISSQLEKEKSIIQLELVGKKRIYGDKHPEIEALKAKLVSIKEQEIELLENSIQQLEIKLRVLEGAGKGSESLTY